ncbi:MAG: caspase family protein [Lewinella sp.]|nr:caspase family protein [Lewinella sp.]
MPQKSLKKVKALVVGIDRYASPVPALSGCAADAKAMALFLKDFPGIELDLILLTDNDANKRNIVRYFVQHLGKAGPDDVAFFYFAGHGTRETASRVFLESDPGGQLQSILCVEGVWRENGQIRTAFLANKELRYLINSVARKGPHILTIFDCCHSGQNTRSADAGVHIRQCLPSNARLGSDKAFPERPWEDFIFSGEITQADFAGRNIGELLPEGRHVQLAAARQDESAFEKDGRGVFTRNLIDLLERCRGKVTYYDLQSRIRNFIKNDFRQTPQMYVSSEEPNEVFRCFLDLEAAGSGPVYGNVQYKQPEGWTMDIGSANGVSGMAAAVQVATMDDSRSWTATLAKVNPGESILAFQEEPPRDLLGKGFVEGFLSAPVKVFVRGAAGGQKNLDLVKKVIREKGGKNLFLADHEYEADYTVNIAESGLTVTRPEDWARPLVPLVKEISAAGASTVCSFLNHISRWEYVRNLHNAKTRYKYHPVRIDFFRVDAAGKEELLEPEGEVIRMKSEPGLKIKIRLTNQTDEKLFVSLLYLSVNFQVFTKLIPQISTLLQPGEVLYAWENRPIPQKLEPQIDAFNWAYSPSWVKLIVSNFHLDVSNLEMMPLPSPLETVKRGFDLEEEKPEDASDWTTRTIEIELGNPNYREG